MFEHRSESILTPQEFAGRMGRSAVVTAGIAAVSLAMGTAGHCYFGDLSWLDGLLNDYDRERLMSLEVPPAAGT